MRATTAKALRNRRSNSRVSLTLAAVAAQATGTPSPVVAMWYLVPRLPRSVGFRPVRSPPRLARTEQLSRIRSGSPRSIATSRACTRWSRLTAAQPASRRRRVEPLAWAGVAFRPRHGVPSRRNRRRVASTRTVSAGGCPGPGSPGPSHRSITVAIRSKILTSNIAPLPCRKARDGHRRGAQVIKPSQPGVDVETGSKAKVTTEVARLAVKITQVKADLEVKIADTKSDLIRWVVGVGFAQVATLIGALFAFLRMFPSVHP